MSRGTSARIYMLGTDPQMRGGIAAVVQTYIQAGLFVRRDIYYLPTHIEGPSLVKLGCFSRALRLFVVALVRNKVRALHVHTASRMSFWRKAVFISAASLVNIPVFIHVHGADFQKFYHH